jgi:hypothetical protein
LISVKKNQKPKKTGKGKGLGGAVKITSRLSVDSLDVVESLPSTWAVPRDRSATLVDLSGYNIPSKRNGEKYTIDGFIRAEVHIQFFFSFMACDVHLPIRIKTHGEVPQVTQRAMLMCIALMRTIPTPSVAVVFNWNAMVLIPASILMRVFSKTVNALSQTRKKCENYGIMSLMQILVKLEKQRILSTGTRLILYSLYNQTYNPTRFYSRVLDLRCKVPCEGKPIMRLRGEVRSCFSY